jgi:hypothetical protein
MDVIVDGNLVKQQAEQSGVGQRRDAVRRAQVGINGGLD